MARPLEGKRAARRAPRGTTKARVLARCRPTPTPTPTATTNNNNNNNNNSNSNINNNRGSWRSHYRA
eukprot:10979482-Alexandrium_andersonii.AAC.1